VRAALHQVVAVGGLLVSEMLVESGVVGAALCQVIANVSMGGESFLVGVVRGSASVVVVCEYGLLAVEVW
jgi:hypothetical protein